MVLCVVDDLIFSIKISTTAKALGVELYFERSADQVVSRVREKQPSLVILDLNSAKLRPMEAIAALKVSKAGITWLVVEQASYWWKQKILANSRHFCNPTWI